MVAFLGSVIYTLKNGTGALHRYEDGSSYTVWGTGGIYEDKYIMDRNIGARDAYTESKDGILYYQFGRKDPFPYTNNAHTLGGTTFTYSTTTSTISNVTMSKAVQNPTTHYYGATSSCWCSDYNSASYVWNNKNLTDIDVGGKSIFDPSPYGFCLPIYRVWNAFTVTTFTNNGVHDQSVGRGFYYTGGTGTELYYPACG